MTTTTTTNPPEPLTAETLAALLATVKLAHDDLAEVLEDDEAGNDDVREAAIGICDALQPLWFTLEGGSVQSAPGRTPEPVEVPGFIVFPPFSGWAGDMNDNLPRFHAREQTPNAKDLPALPSISCGMVTIDGRAFRVESKALDGWRDGMRIIQSQPSAKPATATLASHPEL